VDVPIVKLVPVRERKVSKKSYDTLVANLKAVGLIEPLCVCEENGQYLILDGYLRYTALLEMGVESIPCLVLPSRDLYTPNRQVNHLSASEQIRMLRKALEKLDEETIAEAFGIESVRTRLNTALYTDLHPDVVAELKGGQLTQQVAKELAYVVPKRQKEILMLMREAGDCTLAFAKAQVLATPPSMRSKKKRPRKPWTQRKNAQSDLVKKLAEAEKHYDFYSALYRQYVADLLKLAIYIRQILTRAELRNHLAEHHPQDLAFFEAVLAESERKGAS
jgi:ParB-like chromosome segregation protein Spo0J